MPKIENAIIESVSLGREDHGILTFWLYINYANGRTQGVGGYALDQWNEELQKRTSAGVSLDLISRILDVVGVEKWEDLPGKYIRVEYNGWGSIVTKIGNVLEDEWLDIPEFFKERTQTND